MTSLPGCQSACTLPARFKHASSPIQVLNYAYSNSLFKVITASGGTKCMSFSCSEAGLGNCKNTAHQRGVLTSRNLPGLVVRASAHANARKLRQGQYGRYQEAKYIQTRVIQRQILQAGMGIETRYEIGQLLLQRRRSSSLLQQRQVQRRDLLARFKNDGRQRNGKRA